LSDNVFLQVKIGAPVKHKKTRTMEKLFTPRTPNNCLTSGQSRPVWHGIKRKHVDTAHFSARVYTYNI
jgi:hypothetical protein